MREAYSSRQSGSLGFNKVQLTPRNIRNEVFKFYREHLHPLKPSPSFKRCLMWALQSQQFTLNWQFDFTHQLTTPQLRRTGDLRSTRRRRTGSSRGHPPRESLANWLRSSVGRYRHVGHAGGVCGLGRPSATPSQVDGRSWERHFQRRDAKCVTILLNCDS